MDYPKNITQFLPILDSMARLLLEHRTRISKEQADGIISSLDEKDRSRVKELVYNWFKILNDAWANVLSKPQYQKALKELMSSGVPRGYAEQILHLIRARLKISADKLVLNFGEIYVGNKTSQKFSIQGGPGRLTANNIEPICLSPEIFNEESSEIQVTYTPITEGPINGSIKADDNQGNILSITIVGNCKYTPFVFSNRKEAHNVKELVHLCEISSQDAIFQLIEGHLEKWLSYMGENKLAEIVKNIANSSIPHPQKLKLFLDNTGFSHNYSPPQLMALREIDFNIVDLSTEPFNSPEFEYVITNKGGEILSGEVSSKVNWINVNQSDFSLGGGEKHICRINLLKNCDSNQANGFEYFFPDKLFINSNDESFLIGLKYNIIKAVLQINQREIKFSQTLDLVSTPISLPTESITISNAGNGELHGILTFKPWIKTSINKFDLVPGDSIKIDITLLANAPVTPKNSINRRSNSISVITNAGTNQIDCEYFALSPIQADYFKSLATGYKKKQQYDLAISNFSQAITLAPGRADIYIERGVCYHSAAFNNQNIGSYDLAIGDFSQAINIDPNQYSYYRERGISYHNKGHYVFAIADFDKAIQMQPLIGSTYWNRGLSYQFSNHLDDALDNYSQAVKLSPSNSTYNASFRKMVYKKFLYPLLTETLRNGFWGVIWGCFLGVIGLAINEGYPWSFYAMLSGVLEGLVFIGFIVYFTKNVHLGKYKLIVPIILGFLLNGGWPSAGIYFAGIFSFIYLSSVTLSSFEIMSKGSYFSTKLTSKLIYMAVLFPLYGLTTAIAILISMVGVPTTGAIWMGIAGASFGFFLGSISAFSHSKE